MDLSTTHVVCCISNPVRYASRYQLYQKFAAYIESLGIKLWTVELAFGDRDFVITSKDNPQNLQLRNNSEIWHKENLLNLMVQKLPSNWEKVLWIDADIEFVRRDWLEEAWHQLEHYSVVQLFSDAIDLGPTFNVIQVHKGFVWSYLNHRPYGPGYTFWHPGFAWGATRDAWCALGGLMDFCALGAADHHMALALIGSVDKSVPGNMAPGYLTKLKVWQYRAEALIRRNIGYVPGVIHHYWHGKKKDRKYVERWDILTRNRFDPDFHLQYDWQGIQQLSPMAPITLRDQIREYFRQRNEDSIDET